MLCVDKDIGMFLYFDIKCFFVSKLLLLFWKFFNMVLIIFFMLLFWNVKMCFLSFLLKILFWILFVSFVFLIVLKGMYFKIGNVLMRLVVVMDFVRI